MKIGQGFIPQQFENESCQEETNNACSYSSSSSVEQRVQAMYSTESDSLKHLAYSNPMKEQSHKIGSHVVIMVMELPCSQMDSFRTRLHSHMITDISRTKKSCEVVQTIFSPGA